MSAKRNEIRLRWIRKMAAKLLLFLLLTAVARGQSALDGFDPNANGLVWVVVVQPDGKVLLGGQFTTVSPNGGAAITRNHIARLNPDGTLDPAFNPDVNGDVYAIALQPDGRILVGGQFGSIGGQPRSGIARLNPDGTLDTALDPNPNGVVLSIALQADGKILAGGSFTSIGGQARNHIARLDAVTGSADSFAPDANSTIRSIAVQADGKVLAGGLFTFIGGQIRNHIARLDATTGLADSFDPNANDVVLSIAVQADGKILAGGVFGGANGIGGQVRNGIARLDMTTGLPDSFNPNANNAVWAIAVQADGKILAGGDFNGANSIGGQSRNRMARLDATTGLADSFDPNADGRVYSIAQQADGKILASGDFLTVTPNGGATTTRSHIARLEIDGRLDRTLNLSTVGTFVFATAVQPDGKILLGGNFSNILGVARSNIARLNTDGTLDTAFNPNAGGGVVLAIALQGDGKILAGGSFSTIGGQMRNGIARLDAITGLADSFNPNANNAVLTIAVQADGKILVGGFFSGTNGIGGQVRNHIARLDPTTGLPDSFNPSASISVESIVIQADGKILVGGGFTNIGVQTRRRLARLDPTTGLPDSFDGNVTGQASTVFSIAVQADGKILAGGDFTNIGGQARNRIARLDASTGLADSFDPNANDVVETIAVQTDGKVVVGGSFRGANSIGGQMRNRIARLDGITGLADSFDANASEVVHSIAVLPDGKILAGGFFATIGGQSRNRFARLTNDTAALQNLAVTQTTITWTRGGSSPQFTRVAFEYSPDNVNFSPLGDGMLADGNWILTGLNLSTGVKIHIRAHGYYRSGYNNGSESITESVRDAFLLEPNTLGNISTRLRVETGDNALIGGFIVTGTQPKRVIVRAIGPSLSVEGALVDPILELRDSSGVLIRSNDNWRSDQEAEIIATTIPPSNDLESAIVETLPANNSAYTATVRGVNDGTGVGLIEAYDLDRTVNSKLANISTRGLVQTEENVLIAGTIVLGPAPQRVLVRAIGPSLPVAGKLEDPVLELRNGNGTLIRSNDNWRSDQEAEIMATTIPPSDDLESALVETLPGNGAAYTAIVRGLNNTTGVGLVEVYALN